VFVTIGGLICFFVFRDTAALVYWRIRYFRLPRGTGSGPRVIMAKNGPTGIGVNLVGISEKEWQVSRKWIPKNQSVTLSSERTLVTLGCWWDDSGSVSPLPSDSNGTFSNAISRKVGLADAPVQIQIGYQTKAAAGQHTITPPWIGARGDGFFLVLELDGIDATAPILDTGQARNAHRYLGPSTIDPNSIQSISVSTEGTTAEIGDLAVVIFTFDACDNPDVQVDLPEGWTSIGFNNVAIQNLGYRACCKIVSEPGRQSAACHWKDNSTFAAEAALVVFKAAHRLDKN
jgi:hypothetical protein